MPAAALMGLAVALPVVIAAETGAALLPGFGDTPVVQATDAAGWAGLVCEAARNLCHPGVALIDPTYGSPTAEAPIGVVDVSLETGPAHRLEVQPMLTDLPPPASL